MKLEHSLINLKCADLAMCFRAYLMKVFPINSNNPPQKAPSYMI